MKRISFFMAMLLTAFTANAQTINVHKKSGEIIKYNSSEIDYVDFSGGSDKEEGDTLQPQIQIEELAVKFGVSNNNGISQFGVFGYYTGNQYYNQDYLPNYMYNQQVSDTNFWKYAPVKYWPNEYGTTTYEGADKLSFFAYAPYVDVTPSTGKIIGDTPTNGITAITRNSSTGDPLLQCQTDFDPQKRVDICWGIAASNFTSTATGFAPNNNISEGAPYVNVIKPAADASLDFAFRHAQAWLNVKVRTDDNYGNKTRVWIRSVEIGGITNKATLNLNASAAEGPRWSMFQDESVTIYDGRKDGKEAVNGAIATNEKVTGLNPKVVQSVPYVYDDVNGLRTEDPEVTGVTGTLINLFASDDINEPVYIIPIGQEKATIEITYDIETYDSNLNYLISDGICHGSSIENRIIKKISDGGFEAGKKYDITVILGLSSVKIDVQSSPW